jgi:hypothetical protein
MPYVITLRDDDRMGFLTLSEDRRVTQFTTPCAVVIGMCGLHFIRVNRPLAVQLFLADYRDIDDADSER